MNAYFTANAAVAGQKVTTGTVNVSADTTQGAAPISVTGLLPGDTATTSVTVTNTGTEPVYLSATLPTAATTDAGLAGVLETEVKVGTLTETRSLQSWQSGRLQLAEPLAAGATRTIEVATALPAAVTDAALSGKSAEFSVSVAATQVKNTPVPGSSGWVAN